MARNLKQNAEAKTKNKMMSNSDANTTSRLGNQLSQLSKLKNKFGLLRRRLSLFKCGTKILKRKHQIDSIHADEQEINNIFIEIEKV
jgi:hypothetical protein